MKKEILFDTEIYSYNGTIENNTGKFLVYIHGGSFVEEAIDYQIKFAIRIAEKTQSTLIMPRYKLIPNANYNDLYELMNNLYNKILSTNCDEINFLGDSSGGGFILAYSMFLRDNNKRLPKNILMLSPWVDLAMENEELRRAEKLDKMCSIDGNVYCGKIWASNLDVNDSRISPINGDLNNLPLITIATGGYDVLRPDCLRLDKMLTKANIEHNYIEYAKQGHDFGCYPTKEGKLLINDFIEIINR